MQSVGRSTLDSGIGRSHCIWDPAGLDSGEQAASLACKYLNLIVQYEQLIQYRQLKKRSECQSTSPRMYMICDFRASYNVSSRSCITFSSIFLS